MKRLLEVSEIENLVGAKIKAYCWYEDFEFVIGCTKSEFELLSSELGDKKIVSKNWKKDKFYLVDEKGNSTSIFWYSDDKYVSQSDWGRDVSYEIL